jgi:hypothetical protein
MDIAHLAARAYCLAMDWTGTPPVGWPGRRLPAEWTCHNKCCGGTSPISRVDRRRVLSAINAETVRPRDLTSGSARWLTSRGSIGSLPEQGAQAHRIKPGLVSAPDPCSGQDIPCPSASLWVVRTLLGGIRTPSKGPDMLTWESRTVFGGPGCA